MHPFCILPALEEVRPLLLVIGTIEAKAAAAYAAFEQTGKPVDIVGNLPAFLGPVFLFNPLLNIFK